MLSHQERGAGEGGGEGKMGGRGCWKGSQGIPRAGLGGGRVSSERSWGKRTILHTWGESFHTWGLSGNLKFQQALTGCFRLLEKRPRTLRPPLCSSLGEGWGQPSPGASRADG